MTAMTTERLDELVLDIALNLPESFTADLCQRMVRSRLEYPAFGHPDEPSIQKVANSLRRLADDGKIRRIDGHAMWHYEAVR